jgi:hypothetical protein
MMNNLSQIQRLRINEQLGLNLSINRRQLTEEIRENWSNTKRFFKFKPIANDNFSYWNIKGTNKSYQIKCGKVIGIKRGE